MTNPTPHTPPTEEELEQYEVWARGSIKLTSEEVQSLITTVRAQREEIGRLEKQVGFLSAERDRLSAALFNEERKRR